MTGEYLTVAAVADLLGVSIRTVQRWVARGDLGAVRLPGGLIRIRSADLDSAITRWQTSPPGRNVGVVPTDDQAA